MSLDIHFFKKDVNFAQIRKDIDDLNDKKRTIEKELERLEDEYDEAKLASHNVTHNLTKMAEAIGLYTVLWYPEEMGITSASQMIAPLEKGIKELEANPEKYKEFNPSNGWGDYDVFVKFCKSVLDTCIKNPDAVIESAE